MLRCYVVSQSPLPSCKGFHFCLCLDPQFHFYVQVRWGNLLVRLLNKYRKKLSLQVQWRPLYDTLIHTHFTRSVLYICLFRRNFLITHRVQKVTWYFFNICSLFLVLLLNNFKIELASIESSVFFSRMSKLIVVILYNIMQHFLSLYLIHLWSAMLTLTCICSYMQADSTCISVVVLLSLLWQYISHFIFSVFLQKYFYVTGIQVRKGGD